MYTVFLAVRNCKTIITIRNDMNLQLQDLEKSHSTELHRTIIYYLYTEDKQLEQWKSILQSKCCFLSLSIFSLSLVTKWAKHWKSQQKNKNKRKGDFSTYPSVGQIYSLNEHELHNILSITLYNICQIRII